jgi:hypothetical protein
MAVSINTVYQRVLAILNKEQRGYITPVEFNLLANQAQMSIFEQYFYDINQFARIPGNDTEYSDMLDNLNEKIEIFETSAQVAHNNQTFSLNPKPYKLGSMFSTTTTDNVNYYPSIELEKLTPKEYRRIALSPITKPSSDFPVVVINGNNFKVYGLGTVPAGYIVEYNYIQKPATVNWGYTTVLGEALYNQSTSVDFELHSTEETKLVIKVLELAGLVIQDVGTYQVADAEEKQKIQQEKS